MGDGGGAGGTRTPYLILAKDALSLMSYSPTDLVEEETVNLNRRPGQQARRHTHFTAGRGQREGAELPRPLP